VQRQVTESFFALAEEAGLLRDLPAERHDPDEHHQHAGQHYGQQQKGMRQRPPGRRFEDYNIGRRAKQDLKGLGQAEMPRRPGFRDDTDACEANAAAGLQTRQGPLLGLCGKNGGEDGVSRADQQRVWSGAFCSSSRRPSRRTGSPSKSPEIAWSRVMGFGSGKGAVPVFLKIASSMVCAVSPSTG